MKNTCLVVRSTLNEAITEAKRLALIQLGKINGARLEVQNNKFKVIVNPIKPFVPQTCLVWRAVVG